MPGLRAVVSCAVPIARAGAAAAARAASLPRGPVLGGFTARSRGLPSIKLCGPTGAAWARGILHTASTSIDRTRPVYAGSASASVLAAATASAALADVAPSSLSVGPTIAKGAREQHQQLLDLQMLSCQTHINATPAFSDSQ